MKNANQHRSFFHISLIILLSLIAYSNTFESPFHFDGKDYIVKNPVIKDLHNFTQPSSSRDLSPQFTARIFKRRFIGYLSFALNYRLHGLNVAGYHFVNLFIHICTSLLLYFFILLTFNTPFLRNSSIKDYAGHISLFTALLFSCHPLQTQAVTYIWQRVTSLSTMFYLLSLVAYIKWRLLSQSAESRAQGVKKPVFPAPGPAMLYLLSLASAVLAMMTKEIAFMLPVMLTIYEFIFFRGKAKKRALYLIPLLLTMLIIPLTLFSIDKPIGVLAVDIDKTMQGNTKLSRGVYLLTEFRVLVTYIRLIFLPVHQNLDHDYPRYYSFFNIEVFSSFVFLAIIFGSGIYMLFRYRDSTPHTRLISFGIIWFFINLLLESTVIPLNNVIFEHRMYLPSVGVFLALTTAIFMVINRWKAYARGITVMLAAVIIVLTGATYARNSVWKDELTLWQDVVIKSPNNARGYINLGNVWSDNGLIDKAVELYRIALKLDPDFPELHYNLGNISQAQGLTDSAIKHFQNAIKLYPKYSKAQNNLGVAYASQGLIDKAIEQYRNAIKSRPDIPDSYINLGNAYESLGAPERAMEQYQISVKLDPFNPVTHYNIGKMYQIKGSIDSAIEHYLLAIKLKPYYPKAHHNLGVAFKSKGLLDEAIKHYLLAINFRPDYPKAHHNLANAYMLKGLTEMAINEYLIAMEQNPSDYNVYNSLGKAYKSQGMGDKAEESYKRARELRQARGIQP